jgi:hypothetical protein
MRAQSTTAVSDVGPSAAATVESSGPISATLLRTATERRTESCCRRCPQQTLGTQSPNHYLIHPASMHNNLTLSFLAHSHHPKTERKKRTMKSSPGGYGSHRHQDPTIITVTENRPNCLTQIMILYRRGGPEASKIIRLMVFAKGNANEKGRGIENLGN